MINLKKQIQKYTVGPNLEFQLDPNSLSESDSSFPQFQSSKSLETSHSSLQSFQMAISPCH